MQDVGARAGVSLKTVSRVVNGEAGVSDALVARVRIAVTELDYRHNLTASNLRRGSRTMAVGVLVQDIGNDYSSTLLRAIEDRVRDSGIAVFAASLDEEEEREREMVADLVNRRVDGLVLMPASQDQSYLDNDISAGLAVVVVDRPPRNLAADSVLVDNIKGGRTSARHLLQHGHRRISFISDRIRISTAADRRQGFVSALRKAGIPPVPELLRLNVRSSEAAVAAVTSLMELPDPPTAIFAARNAVSIGVIRALHDLGLSSEIALVGFDDFPMADLVDPPTTVLRQDPHRIGTIAAELLLTRMEGLDSPPRRVVVPTALVPRGSGEIAPAPAGVTLRARTGESTG